LSKSLFRRKSLSTILKDAKEGLADGHGTGDAIERVLLAVVSRSTEYAPYVYVVRLIAYICIIIAIVDKNRRA
jgi:hypothetical protein